MVGGTSISSSSRRTHTPSRRARSARSYSSRTHSSTASGRPSVCSAKNAANTCDTGSPASIDDTSPATPSLSSGRSMIRALAVPAGSRRNSESGGTSSGRQVTTRLGARGWRAARNNKNSKVASSAHCASSSTSTATVSRSSSSARALNSRCRAAPASSSDSGAEGSSAAHSGNSGLSAPASADSRSRRTSTPACRNASTTGPSVSGRRNGGHVATSPRDLAPTPEARNSRSSRVLPIPASPSTSTTAGAPPSAWPSDFSSASRPTNPGGRISGRRPAASRSVTARYGTQEPPWGK
jgi:hypothetical protein